VKITLLTAGSRGDVQPYVALGKGLKTAGHQVKLATHEGFREMVQEYGMEYAQVAQPSTVLSSSDLWGRWQRSGDDFLRYIYYFFRVSRNARAVIEAMMNDFWLACQGADLVVSSTSGFGGPQIAEYLGIHHCWALFQPMSRTRSFPHFMTPNGWNLGGPLNYCTYLLAERVYWLLFKPVLNDWLGRYFERPPMRRPHPDTFLGEKPSMVLYGFSRHIVPCPPDWGDNIKVCGFWNLEPPGGWIPTTELTAFLNNGPPPVYFSLAGVKYTSWQKLVKIVIDALQLTNQRGLIYIGPWDAEEFTWPETVMPVRAIPHNWLLPQVAAMVHHGGAGTTASGLRAGVPAMGIPGFWDQPFWSRRIHELGAGPKPIFPRRLNTERLSEAIKTMSTDEGMKKKAKVIGEKMQNEHGVENAVRFLNERIGIKVCGVSS